LNCRFIVQGGQSQCVTGGVANRLDACADCGYFGLQFSDVVFGLFCCVKDGTR
jgi:hypothetical protein